MPQSPLYPSPRPIAVDLFSGAGGMSLGFEQAGFDVVFAIDRDGHHVATHARNFPRCVSVCGSVIDLTGGRIRELAGIEGEVDLVFGGPPCQGFSHMGLRDHADPRNTLVDEFARIVGELAPKAFVMENVPGMQSGATRTIFERVLRTFEELGYRVTLPVRTLNAKHFGVPQDRTRLFILGLSARFEGAISYPEGLSPGQPPRPTVADALAGLPEVERYETLFKEDLVAYDSRPSKDQQYASVARGLAKDPSDASRPRQWDSNVCSGCMRVAHAQASVRLYAATPVGAMVPGHKLPRLSPDGIAPTLRAGSDSERGAHTAPRPVHPFNPRVITAREAARLHGFPDWFWFYPGKYHAYRQIGNAVAPPVARAVGREVVRALKYQLTQDVPESERLSNEFRLPEDRPRHERRVTQLSQYPKVIDWLFNRAFDKKKRRVRVRAFSHDDIRRAIEETNANLTRTRVERFIEDVARNRGASAMLALPLKYGLSIRGTEEGGEFIPRREQGDILERDTVAVRSSEVREARVLPVSSKRIRGGLLALLGRRRVVEAVWGDSVERIELERDLFGKPSNGASEFVLVEKDGRRRPGVAFVTDGVALPTKTRLLGLLKSHDATRATVLAPLTNEHVMIVAFEVGRGLLRESRRVTYRLKETGRARTTASS